METLLQRIVASGLKEDADTIAKARAYAQSLYFVPSDAELRDVARALGIKSWILCGIVYAQVTVNNASDGSVTV